MPNRGPYQDNFEYVWTDHDAEDKQRWCQFLAQIEQYKRRYPDLIHWQPKHIEALRRALKGDFDNLDGDPVSGEILGWCLR